MNKHFKFFVFYVFPVIFLGAFMLYFSGESVIKITGYRITQGNIFKDKIYHLLEYILFSTFVSRLFKKTKIKSNYFFVVMFFVLVFSIIDETTQFFTPGRTFSVMDILSNVTGCVVSLLLKTEKLLK